MCSRKQTPCLIDRDTDDTICLSVAIRKAQSRRDTEAMDREQNLKTHFLISYLVSRRCWCVSFVIQLLLVTPHYCSCVCVRIWFQLVGRQFVFCWSFVDWSQTSHSTLVIRCVKFLCRSFLFVSQSRIAVYEIGFAYLLLPLANGEGLF